MRAPRTHRFAAGLGATLLIGLIAFHGCASDEERSAKRLERAERYLSENEPEQALIELRGALRLTPQDAEISFRIARVLDEQGETGDALFFYSEAYRLDPTHREAALARARLLLFDDPDAAQELIREVLERDPANFLAHVRRSELALVRGRTDEALAAILTAAGFEPESGYAQLQIGLVRRAQIRERKLHGQPDQAELFEEALAAFERAIDLLDEDSPNLLVRAWLERAMVFASWTARSSEAGPAYREASRAAHHFPDLERKALRDAASYARSQDDDSLERWALEHIVEIASESYLAWSRLAELEEAQAHSGVATLERLIRERPADGRAHALYARRLDDAGRHAEAVAHLQEAAPRSADPATVLATLAELHTTAGELENARPIVERLQREHPDEAETARAAAHLHFAQGQIPQAAEVLRDLVAREENAGAQRLLAEVEYHLGNPAAARLAINRAIELRRGQSPVPWLRLLARIQVAAEEWDAAARTYAQVRRRRGGRLHLEDFPHLARALYAMGQAEAARQQLETVLARPDPPVEAVLLYAVHERDRHPQRARELLEQVAERHPNNARILEQLTRSDLRNGRADAALARIDEVLTRKPQAAPIRMLRARVLLSEGELESALQEAQRAVELDPQLPGGIGLVVTLLRRQGRVEEALRSLEAAHEARTLEVPQRILLGRLLLQRQQETRAVEIFEKVLAERGDLAGVKNDLAFLLAKQGTAPDRALELARSARAARPNAPEFADTLGFVNLRMGSPEPALAQFESAVELAAEGDSVWATAQYHRGLALRALGRESDAALAFEMALASAADFPEADELRRELEALSGARSEPGDPS